MFKRMSASAVLATSATTGGGATGATGGTGGSAVGVGGIGGGGVTASGSAQSPISVGSSRPSTPWEDDSVVEISPYRPRGVAVPGSPSPSPRASTSSAKPLHPFFARPRVPVPRQPRLVATYASTSSSFSSYVDSQGTQGTQQSSQSQWTQSDSGSSFFSSNTEFFSAASELSYASHVESQESQRSRGDVVPPPHGEPSFRPSAHISDLTAELLRLDIRASPEAERSWAEPLPERGLERGGNAERDRAMRAARAGVQRRTASMTAAKEVMEPSAAEWPALSPTSRTVPLKTGYASVAKKGVATAATSPKATVVEPPKVEDAAPPKPPLPASPPTEKPPPTAAELPPTEASTEAIPTEPANGEPEDLFVFSHTTPIRGHFTRPPNVAYTTDPAEVEDLIGCLKGPLSLDLEWPPPGQGKAVPRKLRGGKIVHIRRPVYDSKLGKNVWPEAPVSVVQIADARLVIVFQMLHDPTIHVRARTEGRNLTMPHSMPPALLNLLADPERVKCGVNIKQDGTKLWRDFGVPCAGLLELSAVARHVDPARWPNKGLISLARLSAAYLGADLDKGSVRTGDWSARLDAEQVSYAANDAFAGRLIYDALLRRGRETDTTLYIGNMCASVGCEAKAVKRNAQGPTNLKPTAEPYRPLVKSVASAATSPSTSPRLSPKAAPFRPNIGAVQTAYAPRPAPFERFAHPPQVSHAPHMHPHPPPSFQPQPQPPQFFTPHQPRPMSFPQLPVPPPPPTQGKPLTAFNLFESGSSVSEISARFRLHHRATQSLVLDGASRARSLSSRLQERLRAEIRAEDAIWRNYSVLRCIIWDNSGGGRDGEGNDQGRG